MATKAPISDHERLGITFQEFIALLGTQAMLKSRKLRYVNRRKNGKYGTYTPKPHVHAFNMNVACNMQECGSVSCIGGTMGIAMGLSTDEARAYTDGSFNMRDIYRSSSLAPLFFPSEDPTVKYPGETIDFDTITMTQALKAIANFLKLGYPRWGKILTSRNYTD